MNVKQLQAVEGQKRLVIVFSSGEEMVRGLTAGNIALEGDKPKVHAHIVVGRFNGSTLGGHLLEAHVRPTLEIVLVESPPHLRRTFDPASGLALLDLSPEAESPR